MVGIIEAFKKFRDGIMLAADAICEGFESISEFKIGLKIINDVIRIHRIKKYQGGFYSYMD